MTVLPGTPEDAAKASKAGNLRPGVTGPLSGDIPSVAGSTIGNVSDGTGPSSTSAVEQKSVPMIMTGVMSEDLLFCRSFFFSYFYSLAPLQGRYDSLWCDEMLWHVMWCYVMWCDVKYCNMMQQDVMWDESKWCHNMVRNYVYTTSHWQKGISTFSFPVIFHFVLFIHRNSLRWKQSR